MSIYLYNTLSRCKELFKEIIPGEVGIYTCGPTVYNYAHLGNLRTFLFEDYLVRIFKYNGYKVKRVMNITDVGHLTGDMDQGEDKLELKARSEGRTAWEIASYYTQAFKEDLEELNIISPDIFAKATDNIAEQIQLIADLKAKGFIYKTSDGMYFDISKFPEYTKLSHLSLETLQEGARVEPNLEKRNPSDFAVWKFSLEPGKRHMEWSSPWGLGFPGWHTECSAMAYKFLAQQRDIHCGGSDLINIHHTNEIAQSESSLNEEFFNYWMHGAFLNIVGGKKMSKSKDNFLTLKSALIDKNIDPLAFRYASLQVHYRKPMEYSPESIIQSEQALDALRKSLLNLARDLGLEIDFSINDIVFASFDFDYAASFKSLINDDMKLAEALALVFKLLKSKEEPAYKLKNILDFDRVFGLNLLNYLKQELMRDRQEKERPISTKLKDLLAERKKAREAKDFDLADKIRAEVLKEGYLIEDQGGEQILKLKDQASGN